MHDTATTAGSFALLISIVGASFAYVSFNPPELPKRPWIGIDVDNITPDIAQQLGLEQQEAVLIITVMPESPAERAGLRGTAVDREAQVIVSLGDIIIRADDQEVRNDQDLGAVLAGKNAGDNLRLTIVRDGSIMDVNVTVGETITTGS